MNYKEVLKQTYELDNPLALRHSELRASPDAFETLLENKEYKLLGDVLLKLSETRGLLLEYIKSTQEEKK